MNGEVLDRRGRFREGNPNAVLMDAADHTELARLRGYMATLERPILSMVTELAELRVVAYEARKAMEKVDEHRRKGWLRITVGAFDRLGDALKRMDRRNEEEGPR